MNSDNNNRPGSENMASIPVKTDSGTNNASSETEAIIGDNGPTENSGEITNNDGSVVETLDTALHGTPGYIHGHSPAGSNRADYYETRDDGKSDADEETEYLRKRQQEHDDKNDA